MSKKPTLDEMKAALGREDNLARFLKDSKVQQRMYHATPEDIREFIPGGKNPHISGSAIWLSPNKEEQPAAHHIRAIPDKPGYVYGHKSGK